MTAEREWVVSFESDREVVRAMRVLRGRWGSKAWDHWIVELGKILIFAIVAFLMVFGVVAPRDAAAFAIGYLCLSIYLRRVGPSLQDWAMPDEFRLDRGGEVRVAENGLHMTGPGSDLWMAWRRIPHPTLYNDGLVFRLGPTIAVPFPTEALKDSPSEIAEVVKGWKASDA